MHIPVISLSIADLCQCVLWYLIECFHRPIGLQVIRRALLMINLKFFCQRVDCFIKKVHIVIAYQDLWTTKSYQYVFKKNFVVVASVQSFTSCTSAHLVKYVVAVMMYHAPVVFPGCWIGPTKSITHFSNSCNVTCDVKGSSSLRDGLPFLWHASQALQYAFASLCRVGHHNPARRTFCDVAFPA